MSNETAGTVQAKKWGISGDRSWTWERLEAQWRGSVAQEHLVSEGELSRQEYPNPRYPDDPACRVVTGWVIPADGQPWSDES